MHVRRHVFAAAHCPWIDCETQHVKNKETDRYRCSSTRSHVSKHMVYSITHKSLIHITRSLCAAIVRMVFNVQIVNAGLAKKTDVNIGLTTLMYWSMVEAGLLPIAANLPSVCSLFSQSASLQSTFSSLRSKFTLRSFRSTDKLRGSSKDKAYEHEVASSSNGSSHKHRLKEEESFNTISILDIGCVTCPKELQPVSGRILNLSA